MNVFVTGGTGYVGSRIVQTLLSEGHVPILLIRPSSVAKIPASLRSHLEIVAGDINRPATYEQPMRRCNAVIHLTGIIREFPHRGITFQDVHVEATRSIAAAAEKAGVCRFLHMSALGARPEAVTGYHRSKYAAEEIIRQSGLEWTIFRPSLVVGGERGAHENFVTTLQDLLTMMPFFVPVIGLGKYRFQPVALDDLALGFVRALNTPNTIRQSYDVAGPDVFSFNEMLAMVGAGIRKKKIIHQPLLMMKILARMFGHFSFFPISLDQIVMMEEESMTDQWQQFFLDLQMNAAPVRGILHQASVGLRDEYRSHNSNIIDRQ